METADIDNRFSFHPATPENGKGIIHDGIREEFKSFAHRMNGTLPDGREKSLVITHLEEAMMWANAGIARAPTAD